MTIIVLSITLGVSLTLNVIQFCLLWKDSKN
jgi:hypothetical protein